MSHVTKCSTGKVRFLNAKLLRAALEAVALEQKGRVGTEFLDYYGKTQNAEMSLITQTFPRGIGFVKEGNEYVAKADTYLQTGRSEKTISQIIQHYQRLSIQGNLKAQGYTLGKTSMTEQKIMLVPARRY